MVAWFSLLGATLHKWDIYQNIVKNRLSTKWAVKISTLAGRIIVDLLRGELVGLVDDHKIIATWRLRDLLQCSGFNWLVLERRNANIKTKCCCFVFYFSCTLLSSISTWWYTLQKLGVNNAGDVNVIFVVSILGRRLNVPSVTSFNPKRTHQY